MYGGGCGWGWGGGLGGGGGGMWEVVGWWWVPLISPSFNIAKYTLVLEYHVYIWRVASQSSCGDKCQISVWFKGHNRYFARSKNLLTKKSTNRALVTSTRGQLYTHTFRDFRKMATGAWSDVSWSMLSLERERVGLKIRAALCWKFSTSNSLSHTSKSNVVCIYYILMTNMKLLTCKLFEDVAPQMKRYNLMSTKAMTYNW